MSKIKLEGDAMLFDSHNHTKFSADSQMEPEAALKKAEALGIGLVFTEHLDIGMEGEPKFDFSPQEYWEAYLPLRGERLALGVEVGLTETCKEGNEKFIGKAPLDQVIGSIHLLRGKDLYKAETYAGRLKEEIYFDYLAAMEENVRLHSYIDILGHIDYICRYAAYEDRELHYKIFGASIDKVLRACLETDTIFELNTRRLASKKAQAALFPIYKRYHDLGGRFVSLGSDAHSVDAVGNNMDIALKLAHEAELTPVTFRERKMIIATQA